MYSIHVNDKQNKTSNELTNTQIVNAQCT
jgi:hypothetical protein